jgi:hypothetical protein
MQAINKDVLLMQAIRYQKTRVCSLSLLLKRTCKGANTDGFCVGYHMRFSGTVINKPSSFPIARKWGKGGCLLK